MRRFGASHVLALMVLVATLGLVAFHDHFPPIVCRVLDGQPKVRTISIDSSVAADRSNQFGMLPISQSRIVLIGDSLIREGEWHEWLGPGVLNRGVNGERIATMVERLPQSLRSCPSQLVLHVGINDLLGFASGASGGAEDSGRLKRMAEEHDAAVRIVRARCPSSTVLVSALMPVNCARVEDVLGLRCPIWLERGVRTLNHAIETDARLRGDEFLDAGKVMLGAAGKFDESMSFDGVHLRGEAYAKWAKLIEGALIGSANGM
jgi:lysophospholipase L1-like esterase